MWGAIIGDLAGSIYEYDQIKKVHQLKPSQIIPDNAFFSDDTILTLAVLDAILNDKNYEKYLREYGNKYLDYKPDFAPYFEKPFGRGFINWLASEGKGRSKGNGAMMRISPVGYMFNTEEEIIKNSYLATIPSHNTKEAIINSRTISLIIFYARNNIKKEDIQTKLKLYPKYTPFQKFNSTCQETIENCLYAAFSSNSFEEAIIKVISYGGDTDTNAAITGSIAEALYKIDNNLIETAKQKIPHEFVKTLEKGYQLGGIK